jgi:hypothetical protein
MVQDKSPIEARSKPLYPLNRHNKRAELQLQFGFFVRFKPWARWDSNPQAFQRRILSAVRLPIPPFAHLV